MDSWMKEAAPEGVVSPGVLGHIFSLPEVGDECVVLDSGGEVLEPPWRHLLFSATCLDHALYAEKCFEVDCFVNSVMRRWAHFGGPRRMI